MSIYIKGVDKPSSCAYCPFHACVTLSLLKHGIEAAKHRAEEVIDYDGVRSYCPISQIDPHGDLIDVEKVVLKYDGLIRYSMTSAEDIARYFADQLLDMKPTICADGYRGNVKDG